MQHPVKLRTLNPSYSDCVREVFSSFGQDFQYCQFAFGRYANLSQIYTHAQMKKNFEANSNNPARGWMEKCYANDGDSHFKEFCQDVQTNNYLKKK